MKMLSSISMLLLGSFATITLCGLETVELDCGFEVTTGLLDTCGLELLLAGGSEEEGSSVMAGSEEATSFDFSTPPQAQSDKAKISVKANAVIRVILSIKIIHPLKLIITE